MKIKKTVIQQCIKQRIWCFGGMSGVARWMFAIGFVVSFCLSISLRAQSNTYFRTEVGIPYIPVLSAAPASPAVGLVYVNSTDKMIYKYEGSQWVPVGAGVVARTVLAAASSLYKGQSVTPDIQYVYSGGVTSTNCAVSGCSYAWYRANDAAGTGKTLLSSGSGTPTAYTVTASDVGKYIGLGVTPVTTCNVPAFESINWKYVSALTPAVSSVNVSGLTSAYAIKGSVLAASFTGYTSSPLLITGDAGTNSTYQWYYANDAAGTGKTVIVGKTTSTYTVSFSDGYTAGKYIAVGVTPVAANGDAGTEKMSAWYPTASLVPAYNVVSIVGLTEGKAQNNTTLAAVRGIYSVTPSVNSTEGAPTYKWYYATDAAGTGKTAIAGQTARTHTVNIGNGYGYTSDAYYLAVGITPVTTTGETGTEVLSSWVKIQVLRAADGTLVNEFQSLSGRTWMDRNLGASRVATNSTDYLAYGSLYQWCRAADGHQLITWANSSSGAAVNGVTTTQATTTIPGHSSFIYGYNPWTNVSLSDGSLWWNGTVVGVNNPCPVNYHVPTYAEWNAELALFASNGGTNSTGAYNILKMTMAGFRSNTNGVIYNGGSPGFCWTSTISSGANSYNIKFYATNAFMESNYQAIGFSVRCIKN
jgi:Fibrobacter succinogenes major domain (Fib_succ_major).